MVDEKTSLPSRERGLKYYYESSTAAVWYVAPLAGAWIEIMTSYIDSRFNTVAPLAGAWIEIIGYVIRVGGSGLSLPSRERGLK